MLIPIILFILGLLCLIFGGNWFVDGAVGIAKKMKISEVVIGATVVSIGTTLPEVMVSADSAISGFGGMAYGNALGSIICNTALILSITLIFRPQPAGRKDLKVPIIFFVVSAAIYIFSAYVIGEFTRVTGILLLVIFVAYILLNLKMNMPKKSSVAAVNDAESLEQARAQLSEIAEQPSENIKNEKGSFVKFIFLLIIGAVLIAVGADLLVENGQLIAAALGVPDSVIALTVVALGTSLPELVTAITSLVKKHGSLSLGNIIGANIFNIVLVSGLSMTISPFAVPVEKTIAGMNASLVVDIPLMILVSCILILPALIKQRLYRWQGIVMILLYVGFCVFQFAS